MRRTRIGVAGIALLSAAAIGESLAFIGEVFRVAHLTWIGHSIFVVAVLAAVAKLLQVRRDASNAIEGPDRIPVIHEVEGVASSTTKRFGANPGEGA